MSLFSNHPSLNRIKILITGESKHGKTTLIGTLANAGHKPICILDMDNGLDVLWSVVKPEFIDNIHYVTIPYYEDGAFDRARKLLVHWKDETEDLGLVRDFPSDAVFVIDTLHFLGLSAMRRQLKLSGKSADSAKFDQSIYGEAQKLLENAILARLYDDGQVPCNVIVNTHLQTIEGENGIQKMFPTTGGGRALSKYIGRYFNNVWRLDVRPDGKRCIRTQSDHMMALGNSAPDVITAEEPMDLGALFSRLRKSAEAKAVATPKDSTKGTQHD